MDTNKSDQKEDLTEFKAPMFGWSYEKTMCWFRTLGYDEDMIKRFDDYNVDGESLVLWNEGSDFVNQFIQVFGIAREKVEEISRLIRELTPELKANEVH